MKICYSVLAASLAVLATLNEAAPANSKRQTLSSITKLPGLEKIKHIVYFMQVHTIKTHGDGLIKSVTIGKSFF